MSNWKIAGIGALGGLGLAILKLIDAKFFLANSSSVEASVSYLTYLCYIVLGSIVAVFFTDTEMAAEKMRRSAFVMGLLAPSLLLAIVSRPIQPTDLSRGTVDTIPNLTSNLLFPAAYAQSPPASGVTVTGSARASVSIRAGRAPVVPLTKNQAQPSINASLQRALGRSASITQYAFVVGATADKEQAIKTATDVRSVLATSPTKSDLTAWVLQPEGSSRYFVTVGPIGTANSLSGIKAQTQQVAVTALTAMPSESDKRAAALLLEGKLVPAQSLF
jgi:hypothetical protein